MAAEAAQQTRGGGWAPDQPEPEPKRPRLDPKEAAKQARQRSLHVTRFGHWLAPARHRAR